MESRIIEEHASELKEAITSCESVDRFSDHLLQKDFITRQRQSDILCNASLTPLGRVGRLMEAVLFQVKTNPSKFEVFVDILEKQPPLKDLAAQLRRSYAQSQAVSASFSRQSSCVSSDSCSSLEFSVTSLESQWALLLATLVEILSSYENALMKMKSALEQRVISKSVRKSDQKLKSKFTPVVRSPEFKEAKAVDDFFRVLAPNWNWKEYSLLEFVLQASGCQPAIEKLQEFVASRKQAAPHVILQLTHAVSATPGAAASSEEPCRGEKVVIVMKVNRDELTLLDYDQDTSILCQVARISRHDLALLDTGTGCIAIRWMITTELASRIRVRVTNKLLKELAKRNIMKISIGPDFHLSVATTEYWHLTQKTTLRLDISEAGKLDEALSLESGSTRPRPHLLASQPQSTKCPDSFMHSSSIPAMGVDGRGRRRSLGYSYSFSEPCSGTFPRQGKLRRTSSEMYVDRGTMSANTPSVPRQGKLRRTSSEIYVDRGPNIDTPEEKLTSLAPNPPTSLDSSEGSSSASLPSQNRSLSSHPSSFTSAGSTATGESTGSHDDGESEGEGRSGRLGMTAASIDKTVKRQELKVQCARLKEDLDSNKEHSRQAVEKGARLEKSLEDEKKHSGELQELLKEVREHSQLSRLEETIDELQGKISKLQLEISDLPDDLVKKSELERCQVHYEKRIKCLQRKLEQRKSQCAQLEKSLENEKERSRSLQETAETHKLQCAQLEKSLENEKERSRSLQETAETHKLQCDQLEKSLENEKERSRSLQETAETCELQRDRVEKELACEKECSRHLKEVLDKGPPEKVQRLQDRDADGQSNRSIPTSNKPRPTAGAASTPIPTKQDGQPSGPPKVPHHSQVAGSLVDRRHMYLKGDTKEFHKGTKPSI